MENMDICSFVSGHFFRLIVEGGRKLEKERAGQNMVGTGEGGFCVFSRDAA